MRRTLPFPVFHFALIGFGFTGTAEAVAEAVQVKNDKPWYIAAYAGPVSYTRFNEIIRFQTDFRDSYVAALSVGRVLYSYTRYAQWELEGQTTRHWGKQNHSEINAALLLRWKRFPWDQHLRTSVAIGIGPSYAFEIPRIEDERHDKASRRLLFMPFELTAGPKSGAWECLIRIHHRSGGFDVVSEAGGSNFVTLGLRRWF